MYVCICNGYTDSEIKSVVERGGVNTVDEAYAALGSGICCGTCRDCAKGIIDETLASDRAPMLMAAE